jgi:HK97 gp10 family phage protein
MAHVDGLAAFRRDLQELGVELEKNMIRPALKAGGTVVRDEARLRAPIRSDAQRKKTGGTRAKKDGTVVDRVRLPGNLRRSIRVRMRTHRSRIIAAIGATKRAFYAVFLELGTAHQPAEPFLRPAADAKQGETLRAVEMSLRDQLRRRALKKSGVIDVD